MKRLKLIFCWLAFFTGFSCSVQAACDNFEAARKAAYFNYAKLVVDGIKEAQKSEGGTPINTVINQLAHKYEQFARAGDEQALRKLIGLGLFTAIAANREPLDVTLNLACGMAKRQPPPENVLEPLACATIVVDGSHRENPANRSTARAMVDLAKKNLTTDHSPAGARSLFDTIAPIITACASES